MFFSRPNELRRATVGFGAVLLGGLLGGCAVGAALATAGGAAMTGIEVAGRTTVTAVKTVGHAAGIGGKRGDLPEDGVPTAGRLAKPGLVTFFDPSTGVVARVQWQRGLTLTGAAASARMPVMQHAVDIVRGGRVIYATSRLTDRGPVLAAADVVRVLR